MDAISPVPREARPFQGQRAGLVTRLVANTVDALTISVFLLALHLGINALMFLVSPRNYEFMTASVLVSVTTALLAMVLYMTAAWSITGRTYGDHVMGLRVVGRRGDRVWPPAALVRAALCVGFPIGLLWCGVSCLAQIRAGCGAPHLGHLRLETPAGQAVTEAAFAVLALLVLGWAVISDLLARMNINGPLFFLVAGYLLANPDWGPLLGRMSTLPRSI